MSNETDAKTETIVPIAKRQYIKNVIAVEAENIALKQKVKLYETAYQKPKLITDEQKKKAYEELHRKRLEEKIKQRKERQRRLEYEHKKKSQTQEYTERQKLLLKQIENEMRIWNEDYQLSCKIYNACIKNPNLSNVKLHKPVRPPQTLQEYFAYKRV